MRYQKTHMVTAYRQPFEMKRSARSLPKPCPQRVKRCVNPGSFTRRTFTMHSGAGIVDSDAVDDVERGRQLALGHSLHLRPQHLCLALNELVVPANSVRNWRRSWLVKLAGQSSVPRMEGHSSKDCKAPADARSHRPRMHKQRAEPGPQNCRRSCALCALPTTRLPAGPNLRERAILSNVRR